MLARCLRSFMFWRVAFEGGRKAFCIVLDGYGFLQKLPKINNNNNKSFFLKVWRFSIKKSEKTNKMAKREKDDKRFFQI